MRRHKVQTTVYLETDQLHALEHLSKATRVPMAVYIRDGVEMLLRQAVHVGALPPCSAEAGEAFVLLQDGGAHPCVCGIQPPHYHLNKNKA